MSEDRTIQDAINAYMAQLGFIQRALHGGLNGSLKENEDPQIGFVLLAFPYSEPGGGKRAHVLSNLPDEHAVCNVLRRQTALMTGLTTAEYGTA